ncbi:hypothetical protein TRM7557_01641 [Tritonibacter multivorans]|uniref:TniQ domain-containing protein n=2 Tax=Tritonibacter multivorans TaxID=928856 RepID=A0A0P1GQQ9_9RHOB|nr:TniQ family protein [Tritonibacter multivorans]MDA7422211.1 TniQ family protein [Tritonibacter multivorans]CUH77906.1 hypothetical protein TRM7557_01641 [Tritonibacter multivorans]SFD10171.1 TniQ protein [Tritonibacter multivorans]
MLWPQLPFDPQETLISYADRLSIFHTSRGMERLLRDNGIHHEHFVSGRAEAVEKFVEVIGETFGTYMDNAIRVLRRRGEFRGEPISKAFLSPRAARYCPCCLAEDGAPEDWRFRLMWGFRHVQRCEKHGVWLEPTGRASATNLRVAMSDMPLADPKAAVGPVPTYLEWLRARVHGQVVDETPWLADQTLEHVLAAAEMIGAVLQHGHKVKLTKRSPAEIEEATDIGFSIYSEGPEAVEEALDTIRQTSPATAVQAGPLAHYGKLFDWLDRRCNAIDPGPIRDLLRDHIVKHSAVEPGTSILGVEITERRFHTLNSLSETVGVERKRLARLLKSMGEIPADVTEVECGNLVFEAKETVPLVEAFQSAIPMRDVPDYLVATKHQFEALYRSGILQPLVPRTGRGSNRHVVFAQTHLDEILGWIANLPEIGGSDLQDVHSISYACQRGAGRFENLFADIFKGKTAAFRNPDRKGVGSIYVAVKPLIAERFAA